MTIVRLLLLALMLVPAVSQVAARSHDIVITRQKMEVIPGRIDTVVAMNGSVPGPVLRFT